MWLAYYSLQMECIVYGVIEKKDTLTQAIKLINLCESVSSRRRLRFKVENLRRHSTKEAKCVKEHESTSNSDELIVKEELKSMFYIYDRASRTLKKKQKRQCQGRRRRRRRRLKRAFPIIIIMTSLYQSERICVVIY